MIFVPKLHCRVSVTQQAFVKSLSTPEIQPEEQRALQVWTMLPIEYWQNRLREINEGKRKREMIDLIAAQPCLSPAPFTAEVWNAVGRSSLPRICSSGLLFGARSLTSMKEMCSVFLSLTVKVGMCLLPASHCQGKKSPREDVTPLSTELGGRGADGDLKKTYITIYEKGALFCQNAQIF